MQTLPCTGCRGLCCGPVPITDQEFRTIRKKIKRMPRKHRSDLESQTRFFGTCIFYDADHDKCGIHSVRPGVCQAFGLHQNLACFRNPNAAVKSPWEPQDKQIGILSVDFTWKDFK